MSLRVPFCHMDDLHEAASAFPEMRQPHRVGPQEDTGVGSGVLRVGVTDHRRRVADLSPGAEHDEHHLSQHQGRA